MVFYPDGRPFTFLLAYSAVCQQCSGFSEELKDRKPPLSDRIEQERLPSVHAFPADTTPDQAFWAWELLNPYSVLEEDLDKVGKGSTCGGHTKSPNVLIQYAISDEDYSFSSIVKIFHLKPHLDRSHFSELLRHAHDQTTLLPPAGIFKPDGMETNLWLQAYDKALETTPPSEFLAIVLLK